MPLPRRTFLRLAGTSAAALYCAPLLAHADSADKSAVKKKIPRSGELLPVIGMGTWITFNVGGSEQLRKARTEVLKAFVAEGGGMIDSSPMYGSAEEVVGYGLEKLGYPENVFSATKVWTSSASEGRSQIADSHRLWGVDSFDLLQVHNLVGWEIQLEHLLTLKREDKLRYVGITTSHGRRHRELATILEQQPLDFVQLTYNILDRAAEQRLLHLAAERSIAVIANRPYQGGRLIKRLQQNPLPSWAAEINCSTWAEFLLKYIVSHPAITCTIPATTKVAHMRENMSAGKGVLPDQAFRKKMQQYVSSL